MSWRDEARQAAIRAGFSSPEVFVRQMAQEAHGQDLTSPAGALGPAQIMPATARAWHVNPHDRRAAYQAAAQHMAQYERQFGSVRDALVAYNAGPGRVGSSLPHETQHYLDTILGDHHEAHPTNRYGLVSQPGKSTLTQPSPVTDQKAAMLAALMDPHKDRSLLDRFQSQLATGQYTTTPKPSHTASPYQVSVHGTGGGYLDQVRSRAAAIDSQHLPYQWGGGHGSTAPGTPLDCSGAVSKVLGINPRVASQFMKWGKPGRGRDITVWASPSHVLVEIGGHFWGTSASNPGGGAGWIPRSQISPAYLAKFTPRHPG